MKGSVVTSAVLHGSLLAWALISISAPAHLETGDVEALPVEIVSLTQIQEGDKKAPQKEKAAPKPTTKPNKVENAEHVGDKDVDLKTPPTPEKRPPTTETAAAPPKAEKPLPTDPVPNEVKDVAKEEAPPPLPTPSPPKPEPPKEKPPEPKPPEPKPPEPQAKPAEPPPKPAETGEIPLPASVPTPVAKPKPAEPQKVAEAKPVETKPTPPKTPDKTTGQKKQETAKSASAKESDFNADDISALLNKQQVAGGGAKRSTDVAALGGKKSTTGAKLSMSETDALKGLIESNWSIVPGTNSQGISIQVRVRLNQAGEVIGDPVVTVTGGDDRVRNTWAGGAVRAVMKSQKEFMKLLPAEKYDDWSEVVINFDPSTML